MFYQLKLKDWTYLLVLIILTYLWINYDQLILKEAYQRMIAFPLIGMILMVLFFILVKPDKPLPLSNIMTVILVPLFIILSVIIHLVIIRDGFQLKIVVLWFMTAAMIYLSGFIYKISHRK
jgi:hypothetical protein